MSAVTELTHEEREATLRGIGCSRKRKEDARLIQAGNYVDDVRLPGMLHGDFVRSPYGHARIKSIDVSKAKALPGVHVVLTANDLKPLNLHYMPTLAGDVQAVLVDEKVLFCNQEVAFVIADDRYIAADAVELIEVEYEALPALVDPFQAMQAGRPGAARGHQGQDHGAHEPAPPQPHLHLGGRRQGGDRRRVRLGRGHGQGADLVPAGSPCPLETCACVGDFDKIKGEITIYGTFQAPHVVRTVVSRSRASPRPRCT